MIDENLFEILAKPVTTWLTATITGILGLINTHELLGNIAVLVSIVACIALTRVHILRGNQIAMENARAEIEDEIKIRRSNDSD